jgi:HK97 family phage portal protein
VLRKPNRYQNRIQFVQWWLISKLVHGNTYILKDYDARGVVRALYILDPRSTRPLVAPDGSIYYSLSADYLNGLDLAEIVPARMIIHDVAVPLYHPLCGISPILACALAVRQGLSIQRNSAAFFENGSNPGGVLTAPGAIAPETATRLKDYWDTNFAAGKAGKIAVLGDGLEYEAMTVNAVDAQLIDQLKWTAETVCSCFHVPPYMIGVGDPPNYNNIEALNQQYYSQCLQILIETIELLLDEGLELPAGYGTEFDIDDLLRMDSATMIKSERDAVQGGIKAPNESRRRLNLPPKPGGDSPYLQQQNYSLEALAKRDAAGPAAHPVGPSPAPPAPADDDPPPADLQVKAIARLRLKAAAAGLVGR